MKVDDKRANEIGQKLVVTCGWCEHLEDEDCDGGWCRCSASEHCNEVRTIDAPPCGQYDCSGSYDDMIFEAATVDLPDLLADRAELLHELAVRDRAMEIEATASARVARAFGGRCVPEPQTMIDAAMSKAREEQAKPERPKEE